MSTCTPCPARALSAAGHHGRQRLALAGLHLDDVAVVEREAGDDLLVERPLAERAAGGLAGEREERRLERRPLLARTCAPAQRARPLQQFTLRERTALGVEAGHGVEGALETAKVALDGRSTQTAEPLTPAGTTAERARRHG